MELHGGEALAHSAGLGRGARFTIRLPLDVHDGPEPPTAAPDELRKRARKILIIEDNRDAADSLRDSLSLMGHEVAVAHDGRTGIARARELAPQVVLCDVGLPDGIDGYEVARTLRLDPSTRSTFLVALTGYAQPEDRLRARQVGFDAHVAKPPDLTLLARLLDRLSDADARRSPTSE